MHSLAKLELRGRFVVVIGGGHFGSLAAKLIKETGARGIVVDVYEGCKAREFASRVFSEPSFEPPGEGEVHLVVYDGVGYLIRMLEAGVEPDVIVPAMYGHFVGKAFKAYLEGRGFSVSPDVEAMEAALNSGKLEGLVVAKSYEEALLVASYMYPDMRCNIPCDQPDDFCPTTGREKRGPMYKLLEEAASAASTPRIIRSHLLNAEVGGFEAKGFLDVVREAAEGGLSRVAIGTACMCHGVVNFFKLSKAP